MQRSEIYHNEIRDSLFDAIKQKNRWFAVAKEAPYYKTRDLEKLAGTADIVTVNPGHVVYWEIKSGDPSNCYQKVKKQARAWFQGKELPHDTHKSFISYNPRNTYRPGIGRFRRYHE